MKRIENRKTTAHLSVRATPEQKAYLQEVAALAGVSVSQYLLSAALERPLPPHGALKEELGLMLYHLGKIGGNINQIAYRLNIERPVNENYIHATLDELRETQKQVRRVLGSGEQRR